METTTSLVPTSESTKEPVLLKADVLGRVKHTAQQRQKLLDEFERSGVSGAQFAALAGVKYQTFATWVQARRRGRPTCPKRKPQAKAAAPVKWFEGVVRQTTAPADGAGLLLRLPGGVRLELANPQQLGLAAALIRALEKPC
jgi:hypothetical protein